MSIPSTMRTTITGNATRDSDLHHHPDGSKSASIRIACDSSYYDRSSGEYRDREPEYLTVWARGAAADGVKNSVHRGDPLVVIGRLSTSTWTREDGNETMSLSMNADAIGHNLTFGSAVFTRARKREEEPPHDPNTGELLATVDPGDRDAEEVADASVTDALGVSADDGDLVSS